MDTLINYLLQFGQLNQQQIDLITGKVKEVALKTGDYFSEAGKISKRIAFITEGILRVCYYNSEGAEVTRYFIEENNFVVDLHSYNNRIPSTEYVQAVTDCQLLTFSRDDMEELSATIIGWDEIISKITQKGLLQKINRIIPMMAEDAATRYQRFLDKYPLLVNRIPLSYIASYLGITQSSLSRIRRNY